ncbi:hypothetical protein [Peribacillus glennii]|nr:hypothetical protein [Peribacillus glennii]
MELENHHGTFYVPDKKGSYLFEANFEAEQGTIQYISRLAIK